MADIVEVLRDISERKEPPDSDRFMEVLGPAYTLLQEEPAELRPYDSNGLPGGLLHLPPGKLTVVVPDVHARMDLVLGILSHRPPGGAGASLVELLIDEEAQLVFLGDYVHSEGRGVKRWRGAFDEFAKDFKRRSHMDDEMRESLGTVEMLLRLKCQLPRSVHLLKGNHENILNERGRGNFPFRKFVQEGMMVADYMSRFYGDDCTNLYAEIEHTFPLMAVGERCIITHSEPRTFYSSEQIINYRRNDEVVIGLTWTANDGAEDDAVSRTLDHYIEPAMREGARHFGGHRPVPGTHSLRAGGEYIQIHNPDQLSAVFIPAGAIPDPESHIESIGPHEELSNAAGT